MYYLFSGYDYHPRGGWCDFVGSYWNMEEALKAAIIAAGDWQHIVF